MTRPSHTGRAAATHPQRSRCAGRAAADRSNSSRGRARTRRPGGEAACINHLLIPATTGEVEVRRAQRQVHHAGRLIGDHQLAAGACCEMTAWILQTAEDTDPLTFRTSARISRPSDGRPVPISSSTAPSFLNFVPADRRRRHAERRGLVEHERHVRERLARHQSRAQERRPAEARARRADGRAGFNLKCTNARMQKCRNERCVF